MFCLVAHSAHFILWLYVVEKMVKYHSDNARGNPLLLLISRFLFVNVTVISN